MKTEDTNLLLARNDAFNLANALSKAEAEVAELNRLLIGWKQRVTMSETDLEASKNEAARLCELLEWAETLLCNSEPPKNSDYAEWMGLVHKWRDQKHGLAPEPEEPISTPTDLNQHNKENTPSLNDWRELGPDEVICKGDEVKFKDTAWTRAQSSVGYKIGYWDGMMQGRTCRPLPTINCKQISSKLVDASKQVEMPLDVIEKHADSPLAQWSNLECLRYLRDEIQKLKATRNN